MGMVRVKGELKGGEKVSEDPLEMRREIWLRGPGCNRPQCQWGKGSHN